MLQKVKSFLSQQKKQAQSLTPSKLFAKETPICKVCFKKIETNSIHSILFNSPTICYNCFNEFRPQLQRFSVQNVDGMFVYYYDDVVKEKLYQLKGCFDYELAPIFLEYFVIYLRLKYHGYFMIPAPSFSKADEERGFNHVNEIFKCLKLKTISCIHKNQDIKQADLTSEERTKIKDVLSIDDVDLTDKKILLVDDVYTTGSTMKAMIDLVKTKNPKKIKVLVISKTKDLLSENIK